MSSSKLGKKFRIGELLVQNKILSEEQVTAGLAEQKKTGRKLGRTLVDLGFIDEDTLLKFLSQQLDLPRVDLSRAELNPDTMRQLPETHARRFRAVILEDNGVDFAVAMADPTDISGVDELERILNRPLQIHVCRESELLRTIDLCYRRTSEIDSLAGELREELSDNEFDLSSLSDWEETSEAPVAKLVQNIFEDAVQIGASDIHIEPDETVLRIRQRIDGVLQEHIMKETKISSALVSRLKLISGLNISERRLPQDGRFQIKVKDKNIDVRVSSLPIQNGESVVMRILDQTAGQLNLEELGMPEKFLTRFRSMITKPHGLILVTGPTGSGKTTTLYAALSELNRAEKKIITVEDPVEYRLPRINQVQVNPLIGLTFASVLRAALRQDPDVCLVGEMRDQETAQIGLRAALTGHLVLSTLHTNDAPSTAMRLVDMGIEGYLAASTLRGIIAQRLVRVICDTCKESYEPTAQERSWLRAYGGPQAETHEYWHGQGCTYCNNSGFTGRVGVYELLELDTPMADALRREDSAEYMKAARNNPTYQPLALCALEYAQEGVTTLGEVFRLAGELDESNYESDSDSGATDPPEAEPSL